MNLRDQKKLLFGILVSGLLASALLAQDVPLTNWTVPPYRVASARSRTPAVVLGTSAQAVDTQMAISTTSINFGAVTVGATATMPVSLTNTGPDSFGPIDMFGGAPPTAEFDASQNCQGNTLAAGASCTVTYEFTPGSSGSFSDTSSFTISETSNQADGEDFTVSLTGVGGLTTMNDITPGVPFVGITPCRLVDTRQAGFPAGYGTPALVAGAPRNFDLNSQPACTGIPDFVEAYSLNFTVTQTQGAGFLKVFPQGGSDPGDVSTINYVAGQTIANAAIVPAGTNGGITVIAGVSGTHMIIDINGYFPVVFNVGTPGLDIEGNVPGGSMAFIGNFDGSSEASVGIYGHVASDQSDTAGVLGRTGFVTPAASNNYFAAGVRGEGRTGVGGVSGHFSGGGDAVAGSLVDGSGFEITYGSLGTSFGTDPGGGAAPWAVFGGGDIGASGTKHFIDPHPTNPKLSISYISLEGPEAGTYFRGRAKFQNGIARIPVPEHFRLVTDPEGLTVQITPIGAMASFAVMKMDLDEIVVEASRNVEFSYLVQGVRATFKDENPIRSSREFMPRSADSRMPQWLSPVQKKRLIQNGTYREDGTINPETARVLGWDKVWEQRSRPTPQPAEP